MYSPELILTPENTRREFQARTAMDLIDEITLEAYLPLRGAKGYKTERAILVEKPHVSHRENVAEHSWHIEDILLRIYENRERLGIPDFDINEGLKYAHDHDYLEIWAGDIDVMIQTKEVMRVKLKDEWDAHDYVKEHHPNLSGAANNWANYEPKDTFVKKLVNDFDKIVSTRLIYLDGGKRWRNWEGQSVTMEYMLSTMRAKILTDEGHAMFDVLEEDVRQHPEYFYQKRTFKKIIRNLFRRSLSEPISAPKALPANR